MANWSGQKPFKKWSGIQPIIAIAPQIQDIRALNPLVYYDFRFPSDPILGNLLFQDRAGTSVITATGQPLAYAKSLGSNTTVAVADTDAKIGTFQGFDVGYTQDNIDDSLQINFGSPQTFPITIWMLCNSRTPAATVNKGFWFSPVTSDGNFALTSRGSDSCILRVGGTGTNSPNNTRIIGSYASLMAQYKDADSSFQQNNVTLVTNLVTNNPASYTTCYIGAATTANSHDMDTKAFAIWNRVLTSSEMDILDSKVN